MLSQEAVFVPVTSLRLLAPVGSPETLESALKAGADAVYLGGRMYNARMNAKNFCTEDLKKAAYRCHENGSKIYVTLNTLIFDKNINDAVKYAEELYLLGVDAVITADIGLSRLIKENIPHLELHGSTQMTGHNFAAAKYLADMGFSRMVCAREMSGRDIDFLVKESPIEIEMFVHGAMCVSQSGQCLMSSFIGGRSGNRGECAQPCRLPYNNGYPLSLKDMCLAQHMKEITKVGVASLKIEGRMKSPSYVYSVVNTYRRLLDENRDATEKEISHLASVFSRSGFSDGYFVGKIDKSMLGVRSASDKEQTKNAVINKGYTPKKKEAITVDGRESSLPDRITYKKSDRLCKKTRSARFFDPKAIPKTDYFDIIYLPLERFDPTVATGIVLPPVIKDCDMQKTEDMLKKAKEAGAVHCLVGNIGHIELASRFGFCIHGDYRLNVYNCASMNEFDRLESVIVSPELTLPQIRDIKGAKSVVVYGRLPLMTLERRTGTSVLKDRRGVCFPVLREGGREVVVNSVPIYMADKEDDMKKAGIYDRHFIFTVEKQEEVLDVINLYKKRKATKMPIKRIK